MDMFDLGEVDLPEVHLAKVEDKVKYVNQQ